MSDDTRSTHTKPRKTRRILVVNNPSPEGSSSDERSGPPDPYNTTTYAYHPRPLPSPAHSYPSERLHNSPNPHIPAPLTTNLQCYPSSRSNPSNPALSSPSSTSSPAIESTPPPSTPGLSAASIDSAGDGTLRQDTIVAPKHDRSDSTPHATSRPTRFFDKFKMPGSGNVRRLSNCRPATSPTASTPDSYVSQTPHGFRSSPMEKVIVLVTADAEKFNTVDITGAMTPAFIRERIFTKLQISDEDQSRFSIYPTEIGMFATGDALSDEELFDLYRERGDANGSLKLLVSYTSAPVHEPSYDAMLPSPTVNTLPPPVLPQQSLYAPLRPKPRGAPRRNSQSSASEPQHAEIGYEASVSDDLEHGEQDVRREVRRPLAQQQRTLPNPIHRPSSPMNYARTHSPSRTLSPDRSMVQNAEYNKSRPEAPGANASTPPPQSTSPQHSRFDDAQPLPSPWDTQPDLVWERERGGHMADNNQVDPTGQWRQERDREERERQDRDRAKRRDNPPRREPGIRRGKVVSPDAAENKRRGEAWTMVPSDLPSSEYKTGRPTTPQEVRSPSRFPATPSSLGSLANSYVPRAPPPAPGGSGESRSHKRMKAVPHMWAVSWKPPSGPSNTDQKPVPPPPSKPWLRAGAKSMTDMRATFHKQGLQPGRTPRPPPQLPFVSRPATGGSSTANGAMYSASLAGENVPLIHHDHSASDVTARTYDMPRTALSPGGYHPSRQAAASSSTGYAPSLSTGTSYAGLSPAQDPYPRPHSALGDSNGTAYRQPRQLHSPHNSESAYDPNAHRTTPSPSHHYALGSQSTQVSREEPSTSHPDQQLDAPIIGPDHPVQLSRVPRTPPRSPVGTSEVMPFTNEELDGKRSELTHVPPENSGIAFPHRGVIDEDHAAAPTIRRDQAAWLQGIIDEDAAEGTARPRVRPNPAPLPTPPSSNSTTPTYANQSVDPDDEDTDSAGGTIWAREPGFGQGLWQMTSSQGTRNTGRPSLPPLSIENSPSSIATPLPTSSPSDSSRVPPANFPAPPEFAPPSRTPRRIPGQSGGKKLQDQRISRFDNDFDVTWAPRPPPEDMYDRLEEYFPEHDLDKPVIETPSGGTSPTSTESPAPPPQRFKHKKSIRVVAAERKKWIDRTSRMESTSVAAVLRKRNTKLWGSKLEEVTTEQGKASLPSVTSDSSPGGGAKPIFRWVRGELIGKGTYGKVYLALNATTGEMIAVKQVEIPRTASDKSDSRQVTVVEALKSESETLKDLDHPNIVQYLGFEETPTFLSIFLEYVPGGSIASCLRKHGRFDEQVTKSFTGQILSGLEYLHSRGILHRDMKADNILVETSGVCKISDFGISKRTDDINVAGAYTSMQGTVFWMAPEVINSSKKGYNSKIDIWSVGCVIFEMWTGERPWKGKEAMAVLLHLYETKQGPPVPADVNLTPLADDFRQKCFAMDPDERPTAAELRKHPYLELQPGWSFVGFK